MITRFVANALRHETSVIKIGKRKLRVLLADSALKRAIGLMHRKTLPKDGMLLSFKNDACTNIWMQNMLFPIDIVWIDSRNRVVDLVKGAEPCKSIFTCKEYAPAKPARYVLEIAAGSADGIGIRKGMCIEINRFRTERKRA